MIGKVGTEGILAHAVALGQAGRMKNEIYLKGRTVYIVNYDNTILLKFKTPPGEDMPEAGFQASDYGGLDYGVSDGKITFQERAGGVIKETICPVTDRTFAEIEELFDKYFVGGNPTLELAFPKSALSLLNEDLSHIEISTEDKRAKIIQRDIYTGKIIRLKMEKDHSRSVIKAEKVRGDFGPMGMRTNDFFALFTFCEKVKFSFYGDGDYCEIRGNLFEMRGVVAGCLYDEMGTIAEVTPRKSKGKDDGRKKQKNGRGEQKADPKVDKAEGVGGKEETKRPRRRKRSGLGVAKEK